MWRLCKYHHKKINELDNVENVTVAVETSTISFTAVDAIDALSVKKTLKKLGYPSIEDHNGVLLKAKSFVSCATGKIT